MEILEVISEDGLCYIYLDDIFAETVSEISEYYVFLQKEGPGDLWVKKREKRYFIVEGTPNLPFSFEIKALQRDFEFERMEPDSVLEPEETLWEDGYVEEMEETRKSSLEEFEKEQMRTVETRIFEKEVEYETTE